MTLSYLRCIAEYCDRMFEFRLDVESFELHLDEELALTDKVIGGTSQFCSFLFLAT